MNLPGLETEREEPATPYDWTWLGRGVISAFTLPGLVMAFSFMGFGALLHSEGLALIAGIAQDVIIWALPGQVVLVDAIVRGVPLLLAALAVTLTAVRLLPMVVLVLARARMPGNSRWPEYLAAHFIAATVWVMSEMHFTAIPRPGRLPWLIGLGSTLVTGMMVATSVGYAITGMMPLPLAATLVFFTPAFFLLALIDGARLNQDRIAIVLGAVMGPAVHAVWPAADLLVAGLAGGTLAFLVGHHLRPTHEPENRP